jgi:hypothetical protein
VARHPDDGSPRFVADAVADPLTGLHASVAAATCLADGGRWFVDVSLAGVSAWAARHALADQPTTPARRVRSGWVLETAEGDVPVALPRARELT